MKDYGSPVIKLANFNFTIIVPWTLEVNAGVAVKKI